MATRVLPILLDVVSDGPISQTKDIMALLETRNGDYSALCALGFSRLPFYYDGAMIAVAAAIEKRFEDVE